MTERLWTPAHPEDTQMWEFLSFVRKNHCSIAATKDQLLESYSKLHDWSVKESETFWQALCDFYQLRFDTPADRIKRPAEEMIDVRWFEGAKFNFAEKLLSGKDEKPAIIARDEQGNREQLTYKQLKQEVSALSAGMRERGIQPGDRVAAVMPNVSTTIIAMLAAASIGAVWSSCSPDFGAQAIIDRLGQINPKLLFICDGHFYQGKKHPAAEKIKQISQALPDLKDIVLCPVINETVDLSQTPGLMLLETFRKPAAALEFTSLPFDHPLYIMFSSGTTGKPKCIVHGAGGTLLQHIKELGLHTDIREHDNLCFYTTCGWMMWNWMVSVLALGATLTLYEGSPTYPDAGRLFQVIEDEKITVFGTSAKFISAVEKAGIQPGTDYRLQSLRCILSTGSPLLPKNYDFVYQAIKKEIQLSSISGGTDIISCFALGNPMLPVYRGELQCIGLGMAVDIYDENGQSVQQKQGELVCTKAFPSMPLGFWNDSLRIKYKKAYFTRFPGVWAHGDFAEMTAHKGLIIYGRSDATLNPGGVRIGTAEIYRQVEKIPEVLDAVVVGQYWEEDVRVILFVKLKPEVPLDDTLISKIRQTIRRNASPRHVPAKVLQVSDIPRTINGKIVELAVRQVVHGEPVQNIESLGNPEALDDFRNRPELS